MMKHAQRILPFLVLAFIALPVSASETNGTVLPTDKHAWGDRIGWINFAPTDGSGYAGLHITDSAVTGYAWSRDYGWINFSPTNSGQGVTNTSEGQLGGYAWVGSLGWLSMSGVTIGPDGKFTGIAGIAGSDTGRVSFDCGLCSVRTDWRPASVRDGDDDDTGTNNGGGSGGGTRPGGGTVPADPGSIPPPQPPGIIPFFQNLLPNLFGTGGSGSVAQSGTPGTGSVPDDGTPEYLLDISLRLERSVLTPGEPLVAYASFANFGLRSAPVDAVYVVRDASGTPRLTSRDSFILETERTTTKTFDTSALTPGTYTLHLRVVYGAGTVEEFSQPFTIVRTQLLGCWLPWPLPWLVNHVPFFAWLLSWFGCWFPWILLLLLIVAYWTYRRIRKRRRERMQTPNVNSL